MSSNTTTGSVGRSGLARKLVAPNSLRSEALALLFVAVGEGDVTEDEAMELHERLTTTKIRLLGDRVSRRTAWRIARENQWNTMSRAGTWPSDFDTLFSA